MTACLQLQAIQIKRSFLVGQRQMAAPSEAFPLANRPSGLPRVTPFLVKVTDSGLKSLQDALQSTGPTGSCSSITFKSSEGQIVFGANARPFKFTVSDMQQDMGAKGPLEAAEQFITDGRWCKLGLMRYRATIMATDDSYQSTKRKALQAEEEAKRTSAKVLKQPKAAAGASKASAKIWKKVNDAATAMSRCQRVPASGVSSSECKSTSSMQRSPQRASAVNHRGLNVTKKSLRERIIHHLLIRCCSPKELLIRLVKEGLNADEKQNFESTFEAVAQMKSQSSSNGGTAVYELKQQCLSEVSDEWPFYSSWDRQLAKRALAARLSVGSKRDTSGAPLEMVPRKESKRSRPVAGSSASSNVVNKQTHGARSILDDLLPSDNGCIASAAAGAAKVQKAPAVERAPANSLPRMERRSGNEDSHGKAITPVNSSHIAKSSNGYEGGQRKRPYTADMDVQSPHDSSTPSVGSQGCSSNNAPSEGRTEYPDIDTYEERQRYKELFDRDYPRYLRETSQGSTEYAAMEREICDRYKRFREDASLNNLRNQHNSIRAKLAAIKSRVVSFDRRHQGEFEEVEDSD
uniref:RNA polymerase II elongation factor ELL N-terminal domain-containing protein n=1 Tax=Trichuris muris TaxID=70415 RepID=A0A5S6Q404_TRIMR